MPSTESLIEHWYFHGPSLAMLALMAALAVRFLIELATGANRRDGFAGMLATVTAPAFVPVRWITPQVVPNRFVVLLAILWLMAARVAWYLGCTAAGMRLSFGG